MDDSGTGQQGEGAGDFVVQCSVDTASNTMTEMFRCSHDTKITSVHHHPQSDNSFDLGTDTNKWRKLYAVDLELISTDSGAAAAPTLKLQRDSSSPANGDILGQIMFGGKDSTPNDEQYAMVAGKIIQAGAGGEHGAIQITTRKQSAHVITANLTSTDYQLLNGTNLSVDGDITGNGNFQLTSTDTGSAAAPELTLHRNSTSPADADYLGQIKFSGKHDAGSSVNYAKITGKILDASNGSEDGILEFMLRKAGSNNIAGRFRSDKLQLINGTGLEVAGQTTFSDHVSIPDDKELTIGDSADLKLSHSTSLSSISSNNVNNFTIRQSAGSGFMFIHADQLHLRSQSTNEPYLVATNNGAVELYHNNTCRLTTSSDGVDFGVGGANDILHISGQTIHRTGGNGCGLHFSSSVILPTNAAGTTGDQTCSLGNGSNRFTSLNVMQLQVYDRVGTDLKPYSSNTYDLGSTTYRWRNVYTNDLNLSNEGSSNDVDGTWGNYTIQEGEDDLFLINRRSGKKYKFNLTEVS